MSAKFREGSFSMFNRLLTFVAAVLIFLAVSSPASFAQDVSGVTGTVTDKTGAAVADAAVKLTDTRTGAVYETKTGSFGAYTFAKVAPGPGYTLAVTKDNFKTATISNLYLAVATVRTQDVVLEIGAINQTVEVKSEGSVSLNTTDTTIGNNFDLRTVASPPAEFRDSAAALLRLEPGVVNAPSRGVPPPADPSGSRDGSIAGARADQNNITVDGIDATDFGIGQAFIQVAPTPIDAIQEFNTQVGDPTSAYGRGSGAQTVITTKSGSNDWHGSAREYNRTAATEANTFFNNKAGVAKPGLIRNQFGANLGGAAKKDKLFFFFDYEGRRDISQLGLEQIVPLDSFRGDSGSSGGLAYIHTGTDAKGNPCDQNARLNSAVTGQCISILTPAQIAAFDPCSKAGAPGPCTASGQAGGTSVTPGINQALLQFIDGRYPHANDLSAGDGINTGGFRYNAPVPLQENIYTTRVDYNINSKQKLFTRFNFNNVNAIQTPIQFTGDPVTGPQVVRDKSWVIGHTWTFSANTVNQFVYGETRAEANFPINFNPAGTVFPLNWFPGTPLSNPFARQSTQSAINPVPTF
ncbi:MAG: carboxypeptidase regulatory-like domain-containing protein, partial [Candidatus Acidiferrales bacterium]